MFCPAPTPLFMAGYELNPVHPIYNVGNAAAVLTNKLIWSDYLTVVPT